MSAFHDGMDGDSSWSRSLLTAPVATAADTLRLSEKRTLCYAHANWIPVAPFLFNDGKVAPVRNTSPTLQCCVARLLLLLLAWCNPSCRVVIRQTQHTRQHLSQTHTHSASVFAGPSTGSWHALRLTATSAPPAAAVPVGPAIRQLLI